MSGWQPCLPATFSDEFTGTQHVFTERPSSGGSSQLSRSYNKQWRAQFYGSGAASVGPQASRAGLKCRTGVLLVAAGQHSAAI